MRAVHRALDEPLGRCVVFKVLKPSRSNDESAVGSFVREACVLAVALARQGNLWFGGTSSSALPVTSRGAG